MNVIDAAFVVLRDAVEPLHYREITERVLAQKLWTTGGKTPWETVNARLSVDIKSQGSASRFVRVGPGQYELNPDVTIKLSDVVRPGALKGQKKGDASESLTFTDAAERVLLESDNHEPLHYSVITKRALKRGLIRTEGRTPAATMYSAVLTEIRRHETRGETPRFVQHGRGIVGLSAWLPVEVAGLIEDKNREVRQALLDRALAASPTEFENLVVELLAAVGFEDVELTPISADGGIDVRGTLVVGDAVRIRMAVQAKRWKNNVSRPVVQQVRGSLGAHEQGLIITTSDFSKKAKTDANRSDAAPVALMNGERLAALLAKYQIGTYIKRYELLILDENGLERDEDGILWA